VLASRQNSKEEAKLKSPARSAIKRDPSPQMKQCPTYESYFEIDKPVPDESCSLKDLFSQRGQTKKRPYEEPKTTASKEASHEERNKDTWITNKKKRYKKKQEEEDSSYAERFEQMSQAFFKFSNLAPAPNPSLNPGPSPLKNLRDSIGGQSDFNQSSVMSAFGNGIRFDPNKPAEAPPR